MRKEKLKIRHRRKVLISELYQLESANCNGCERPRDPEKDSTYICQGCPIFNQIRDIGDELNDLSNKRRMGKMPNELTKSSYLHLRECGWTQLEICKHYEVGSSAFHFFLISNALGRHIEVEKKTKNKITITTDEYYEMRDFGLNDKQIAEKIGVAPESVNKWKKRKGVGKFANSQS